MSLQVLDPQSQQTLSRLKQDVAPTGFRTFLIKNSGSEVIQDIKVKAVESGIGKADASELANRSVIQMDYTGGQEFIGVSPIRVMVEDETELEAILLDGWLQLSADTFRYASKLILPELAKDEFIQIYVRYARPAYSTPNVFRFTLKNLTKETLENVVLTRQGMDQLSLDGETYSNSVTLGDVAPQVEKTVCLKSYAIDPALLGPAVIEVHQGSTLASSLPFDSIGSGRYYCSVDEVRNYLTTINVGIVSEDEEIRDLITLSAQEIDRATRRRFDVATVTEQYDGAGQQKLVVNNYPIIKVHEIKIYNLNRQLIKDIKESDSEFSTAIIIDYDNGFLTLPSASYWLTSPYFWPNTSFGPAMLMKGTDYDYSNRFGKGIANIEVNYSFGFQVPPEGIRDACKKMVVIELLKKKGASDTQGSSVISIAGMTETFTQQAAQKGSGPFAALIGDLQADIDATLDHYRKKRLLVI